MFHRLSKFLSIVRNNRIPFRLIALRQAIRKHMTYASIALRGTKTDMKQFDYAIYVFISFSCESIGSERRAY